jgi:hypothetical protein
MERERRPIDLDFIHSIFNRIHPDAADKTTIKAA